jgi:hypothetical protein
LDGGQGRHRRLERITQDGIFLCGLPHTACGRSRRIHGLALHSVAARIRAVFAPHLHARAWRTPFRRESGGAGSRYARALNTAHFDSIRPPVLSNRPRSRPDKACAHQSPARGAYFCVWPMRRFEYLPSGIRDRDAANFDRLVARLNGLELNRCEPATSEAA